MASVHNGRARMPAILPEPQRETWLAGSSQAARELLCPYPQDLMDAYPVGTRSIRPATTTPR